MVLVYFVFVAFPKFSVIMVDAISVFFAVLIVFFLYSWVVSKTISPPFPLLFVVFVPVLLCFDFSVMNPFGTLMITSVGICAFSFLFVGLACFFRGGVTKNRTASSDTRKRIHFVTFWLIFFKKRFSFV